jgi:serine protease
MRFRLAILALTLCTLAFAASLDPAYTETQAPTGRIVVKFAEDAKLQLRQGGLQGPEAGEFQARLASMLPGYLLERRFSQSWGEIEAQRLIAIDRSVQNLPDLNTYATLSGASGDRKSLLQLLRRLKADPAVETAFLEPVAVPAALGFDAFTGAVPEMAGGTFGDRTDTPDFISEQGYLNAPPEGVNAWAVEDSAGADGATVQVVDVEGAWLWSHEDLPTPVVELGGQIDNLGWRNHGTAVIGEVRGGDNGYGVRGIAPATEVGGSSIAEQWTSQAIYNAALALNPGDIIIIELHAPGPNATGEGQVGYVCMEYWQDNFDAIQMAAALGILVCEAAGNGGEDLDDPVYQGFFDRSQRDSGAILCGASVGSDLDPASFTNYGSRVDLHGWGYNVATTGYGYLYGGDTLPEEFWYTSGFNGTSSATPIVAGSVAALQGLAKARWGFPLDAKLARDLLVVTGTPQWEPETHIGPRPDIFAAWQLALNGIGELVGTVTDSETGDPIEGAKVYVAETASFDYADAAGEYRIALPTGFYNLEFSAGIFYQTAASPVLINDGLPSTVNAALDPTPTLTLAGYVERSGGHDASGVRVRATNIDLNDQWTDGDGYYEFVGVPVDTSITLLIDSLPGHNAVGRIASTYAPEGTTVTHYDFLSSDVMNFEANGAGFTADSLWAWGAPLGDTGPATGFSGDKCWGVGMDGDYPDNSFAWLTSPSYDLAISDIVAAYFSMHFWSETESGFDGARVEFWSYVTGEWQERAPMEGYRDFSLSGIGYKPGWSGVTDGWQGTVFDISDLLSSDVRVRIAFGSDGGVNGPGFWIDDLNFYFIGWPTDVESPDAASLRMAVYPNPFNPKTTLYFDLLEAGPVEIAVYDLEGRLVERLADEVYDAGEHRLEWNADGIASGVYFLRLVSEQSERRSKVLLLK